MISKKNYVLPIVMGLLLNIFLAKEVQAGSPDGSGPWADSVVSANQGFMKNGQPVPAARSNPQAALGVAEQSLIDTDFFSLGFGGNIVLRFDNGVRNGLVVIETTFSGYPVEKADVSVSTDGTTWISAGIVNQDGQISIPENVPCVNYVKITDVSNSADFSDETADAYDVDGVQAINAQTCDNQYPTPTLDPSVTPINTPTPVQSNGSSNSNGGSSSNGGSQPKECSATKPGMPTITSIQKTSSSTVKIIWTSVNLATSYAISYGNSKGNYQYGVPSTGNVTEFTIGGLDPNAQYFFQVRALNDCMPGDGSNEQSTNGGQVLGVSTGEVLGASTEQLAATGNIQNVIHSFLAVLASALTYIGLYMLLVKQKRT